MADENVNATAIIGLLVGFLVVGVIGVYVGEQLIAATDLQGTALATVTYSTVGTYTGTVGAGVYSIDVTLVGSGGGGGAGNDTRGGGAGGAGTVTAYNSISVLPGQALNYTIGAVGTGGDNTSGIAGGATSVTVNGVPHVTGGGTAGGNHTAAGAAGAAGVAGWNDGSGNGNTGLAANGTGGAAGAAGARGYLRGAGGPGGGAGTSAGTGGNGAAGAVQITTYTSDVSANPMAASQTSIVETFQLGVILCKIIIIVSVASIVFMLLQRTGLIPRFGGGEGEGGM